AVRGPISPGEFVPLAERYGLLRPLTLRVLDEALRATAAWAAEGVELPVAVNLSAANLLDLRLADDIAGLLEAHAVPPERLHRELTESTVMVDADRSVAVLDQLAATGVRLSVDDFGTGYSSLARLIRLPISELKIDRSFVSGMLADEGCSAIVTSVVELAHS